MEPTSSATPPGPAPPQAPAGPSRSRRAAAGAVALLAALAAVFLLLALPDIRAPFGHSDEGINGAVWGDGSRSYRELGPLASALGGRRLDGRAYATHPPGLLTETALAEWVFGEHRWSTRAPAWIGSLAAVVLLYLLVRALGLARLPAAAATVAGLATPMFLTYGWMLDTPVTSFPVGVAAALCWQRSRDAADPPRLVPFALALLAGVSGWEATAFVCVLGSWTLAECRPSGTSRRRGVPYLLGGAVGFALSVGWGWWVYGDLGRLRDKLLLRSTGEASGLADSAAFQARWATLLLGVGLLGLAGCVGALRDERFRTLAGSSLLTVVGYAAVFRGAAGSHPFWNYWLLLPATLGYAYLCDLAVRRYGGRAEVPLAAGAVALLVVGAAWPGAARENIRDGTDAVAALRATPPTPTQTELPYLGDISGPEDWMLYELGVRGLRIDDPGELGRWADTHPDQVVLVVGPCGDDRLCDALWDGDGAMGDYRVRRGREVAERLGTG